MKELLAGVSDAEVRELCIQALRTWRQTYPHRTEVAMHGDLGRHLVQVLLRRGASPPPSGAAPHEALAGGLKESGLEPVAEFVNWFVRAGFAWPLGAETNRYPITLHLTRAGVRFLDDTKDHPLLPGFVDRIAQRCIALPEDVVSLLVDARSCLDHALMRPAIQLMGVAYEVAIEHIVDSLVKKGVVPQGAANHHAAKRIEAVEKVIDQVLPNKDDRYPVRDAYDFADRLRERRNDAAHTAPKYDFSDRDEAEEFLISAGRHLPNLWRMFQP
jgi:hypothetical protein